MSDKEILERIRTALKLAKENNVQAEFVFTALKWMKENPSISIDQAIIEAEAEYDL